MRVCFITPQMLKSLLAVFKINLMFFQKEWEQNCPLEKCLKEALAKKVDVLTFWQRFPDVIPRYKWYLEWVEVALLDIRHGYNYWWERVSKKTRNMIRKARKMGVTVKLVELDEDFAKGVAKVYNETPVRRRKPFKHYGKTWKEIYEGFKVANDTTFIGAYYGNDLIGFAAVKHTPEYSLLSQLLSLQKHLDKEPNYALLDKVVEVCASKGVHYIVYERMQRKDDPLGFFKRRLGFNSAFFPRYFVPLTVKGVLAIELYKKLRPLLYTIVTSYRLKNFIRQFYYIFFKELSYEGARSLNSDTILAFSESLGCITLLKNGYSCYFHEII